MENSPKYDQPPPYFMAVSGHNFDPSTTVISGFPTAHSQAGGHQQFTPSVQPENRNLLSAILSQHNRFILIETEGLSHGQPRIIQIQNEFGRVIMSSMVDLGTNLVTSDSQIYVRTPKTINFLDPSSGDIIMTGKEMGKVMTFTSENRILGVIHGCSGMFPKPFPKDINGSPICRVVKEGPVRKFIATNGQELGQAGVFGNSESFEVRLSPSLDVNTKAMLLNTAFYNFLLFDSSTFFGRTGTAGAEKCQCCLQILFILIVLGIFIAVVTHFSTKFQEDSNRMQKEFRESWKGFYSWKN